MQKKWVSLGLMSGTSGDGVDASIIKTNGTNKYESLKDKYFEYDSNIFKDIHNLKEKIHSINHLEKFTIIQLLIGLLGGYYVSLPKYIL